MYRPMPNSRNAESRAGRFALTLAELEAVGRYSPDGSYSLGITTAGTGIEIAGDLGAFWADDLTWSDSAQTLTAGPVPETDPDLPTELRLVFDAEVLLEVVASLPSRGMVTFSAIRL
jgi:hypothetical protein